jgi:hypothetical protein
LNAQITEKAIESVDGLVSNAREQKGILQQYGIKTLFSA